MRKNMTAFFLALIWTLSAVPNSSSGGCEKHTIPGIVVLPVEDRLISLDGLTTIALDDACRFNVSLAMVDDEFSGWTADFIASFSSDVVARSIVIYEKFKTHDWVEVTFQNDVVQGDEISLLETVTRLPSTFDEIISGVEEFNCGIKDVSGLNDGVEVKITLRLFERDAEGEKTGRSVDVVEYRHRLGTTRGCWFDANIDLYRIWPKDGCLAHGASWVVDAADFPAADLCCGESEIELFDEHRVSLVADRTRRLSERDVVRIVSEIEFSERDIAELPPVDPAWKGAVALCSNNDGLCYYGIVKNGRQNSWVKLDGPAPKNDGSASKVELTVRKDSEEASAIYAIDGETYAVNGASSVPIVLSGDMISRVNCSGRGVLKSLFATVQRRSGLAFLFY